ncbi:MAG: extracellular solute-binding protein [Clostridia bacterium]
MKKLLSLVLALAMAFSATAAFAEEVVLDEHGAVSNPEVIVAQDNELIFWSLFSGGEGSVMEGIVSNYNATNPQYTIRNVQLDWGEYYTKLTTAVAVGKGPDIGISHLAKLPELYSLGVVTALDDAATAVSFDWNMVNQNNLAACTIDGAKYAVPLDTHPNVMYYNKDLLKDFLDADGKLVIPTGAEGFSDWLAKVQAAMPEGKYAFSLPTTGDDPFRAWWSLYFQDGGTPVITSDLQITLDEAKTVEVLNYMKTWYDNGFIPANLEDYIQFFTAGNAAITFGGVWNTFTVENVEGLNFGVTLTPQCFGGEGDYAIWGDSHTFIVPVKASHTDEQVQACVKFFDYASQNSIKWATAGHVVANLNVVNSPEYAALPYRSDYKEAANFVKYFESTPYSYPIRDAIIAQLGAFFSGEQDAPTTYQMIVEEIQSIIS